MLVSMALRRLSLHIYRWMEQLRRSGRVMVLLCPPCRFDFFMARPRRFSDLGLRHHYGSLDGNNRASLCAGKQFHLVILCVPTDISRILGAFPVPVLQFSSTQRTTVYSSSGSASLSTERRRLERSLSDSTHFRASSGKCPTGTGGGSLLLDRS